MKKIVLISCFALFHLWTYAQLSLERQVIGNAGGIAQVDSLELSFTLGESMFASVTRGTFVLHAGFQQADDFPVTNIDIPEHKLSYSVYPNPTQDWLYLDWQSEVPISLKISIINAKGQILPTYAQRYVSSQESASWQLNQLSTGTYFLLIQTAHGHAIGRIPIQKI